MRHGPLTAAVARGRRLHNSAAMASRLANPIHRTNREGDCRALATANPRTCWRVANDTRPRSVAALSLACVGMHALRPARPQRWQTNEPCFDPSCQSGHSSFPPATRRRDRCRRLFHRLANSAAAVIAPQAEYAATSPVTLGMLCSGWRRLHPIQWDDPCSEASGPRFAPRLVAAVQDPTPGQTQSHARCTTRWRPSPWC